MEIKREEYLKELISKKDNDMIKVITGIRRCGKSYLLFKLFKDYLLNNNIKEDHIIEIALDSIDNDYLREPKVCFEYVKDRIKDKDNYYLFMDEVQFMNRFEEVLNGLKRIDNLDIYVTGSNSKFLSTDIITEFRGRGDEIKVHPLSFKEYYIASNLDYYDALTNYMTYGGLPELFNYKEDKHKQAYLKNTFNNVYIRDVIDRNKLRNDTEIGVLLDVLASTIGSYTNPTKISNTFKSERNTTYTNKTISNHIDYLIESFLISRISKYDIKGRKYIGANYKYYFEDIGLRNARLNFRQIEKTHILENIVYNELIIRGYSVDVGVVEINETNSKHNTIKKHLEVDFIINDGDKRFYIQVANNIDSDKKKDQEFKSIRNIDDSFSKIVILDSNIKSHYNDEGFYLLSLKDFLLS